MDSGAENIYKVGNISIDSGIKTARELFKKNSILTSLFIDSGCVYAIDNTPKGIYEYYSPVSINEKVVKLALDVCFAAEVVFYRDFNRPNWLESIEVIDGDKPIIVLYGSLGERLKVDFNEVMSDSKYSKLAKPLDELIELLGSKVNSVGGLSIIDWAGTNSPHISRKYVWCCKKLGDTDWNCILKGKIFPDM